MAKHELENTARWNAIRDYIIKHQDDDDCIPTKVIEYMEEKLPEKPGVYSSSATTLNILGVMEQKGTVIVEVDKENRRKHHLHINDYYSILSTELDKIEKLMNSMDIPIRKILDLSPPPSSNDQALQKELEDRNEKPTHFTDLFDHFVYPYEEGISMMLRILSAKISDIILSEKDRLFLHTRISGLILKLKQQFFSINKEREYLDYTIWELKTLKLSTTKAFAKKSGINIDRRKEIISKIKDFEKGFLS